MESFFSLRRQFSHPLFPQKSLFSVYRNSFYLSIIYFVNIFFTQVENHFYLNFISLNLKFPVGCALCIKTPLRVILILYSIDNNQLLRFKRSRMSSRYHHLLEMRIEQHTTKKKKISLMHIDEIQLFIDIPSHAHFHLPALLKFFRFFLYSFQSNKPIMEKKRRARINHCLDELKKILLENVNKDVRILVFYYFFKNSFCM